MFSNNMSVQQVKGLLSRFDEDGNQIIQDHFVQKTLKDVMANPETFDKNAALISLNKTIATYKDVA